VPDTEESEPVWAPEVGLVWLCVVSATSDFVAVPTSPMRTVPGDEPEEPPLCWCEPIVWLCVGEVCSCVAEPPEEPGSALAAAPFGCTSSSSVARSHPLGMEEAPGQPTMNPAGTYATCRS